MGYLCKIKSNPIVIWINKGSFYGRLGGECEGIRVVWVTTSASSSEGDVMRTTHKGYRKACVARRLVISDYEDTALS